MHNYYSSIALKVEDKKLDAHPRIEGTLLSSSPNNAYKDVVVIK